jgi:uncharacterized membrane protein (UPF0127 family)
MSSAARKFGGRAALKAGLFASGTWVLTLVCAGQGRADDALQKLEIDTASGPHVFNVEVVRTPAERERGLMDRRTMPQDRGMLFDFQTEQPVIFWMKDTYIPLDMIFVAQNGRVVGIKHDAKPMDETLIPSGAPALGVIELNGGVTNTIGLKIGDMVKNPLFHAPVP